MIRTFDDLIMKARDGKPQILSVAVAQDLDILSSVRMAYDREIISGAILVGDEEEIRRISKEADISLDDFEVIHEPDKAAACNIAIELVRDGRAGLPMKGFVDTNVVLKALLNRDNKMRTEKLICHVGVLQVRDYDRLFFVSDSAMTIAPTLENKVDIIRNTVEIAHALGIKEPKVAVLCAVEKENSKMPCTMDAVELTRMNEEGLITGCLVKGPLALDNAISTAAAMHKGIIHPVAGNADILIAPTLEAGNILNKSMEYFGRAEKAGIITGAKVPLVLTSRASSEISKMNSIALGVLAVQNRIEE